MKLRKALIIAILSLVVPSLFFWLYLFLDMDGAYMYYHDLWALQGVTEPHPTGYSVQVGYHELSAYNVTAQPDGLRFTPGSVHTQDCVIAAVGDSVTFGLGVEDDETFSNLIAASYGIEVWNTGRNGYNAEQALEAVEYYNNADGYIYLNISNDADERWDYVERKRNKPPTRMGVFLWMQQRHAGTAQSPPIDMTIYNASITGLLARKDVLSFSFHEDDLILIPQYTKRVSNADPHPNAQGHQQIANMMQPYIDTWLPTVCNNLA